MHDLGAFDMENLYLSLYLWYEKEYSKRPYFGRQYDYALHDSALVRADLHHILQAVCVL